MASAEEPEPGDRRDRAWRLVDQHLKDNGTLRAKVTAVVKGGVVVDVHGLRGFVPASQLRVKGATQEELIGMEIPLKILEADKERNKLILSQRLVVEQENTVQREKTLNTLQAGQLIDGEIVRIADFAAFIEIGGVDCLLPISEISDQRLLHPSEMLKVGDSITTKVLKVDLEKGYVTVSRKQADLDSSSGK